MKQLGLSGSLCNMSSGERAKKLVTVVWAIVIGGILLFLGTAILLPSTKRASPEMRRLLEQQQRDRDRERQEGASSTTQPAMQSADPTLLPSTKSGLIRPRFPQDDPAAPKGADTGTAGGSR